MKNTNQNVSGRVAWGRAKLALATAVGAVALVSGVASAQYRLENNDGRRLDANNRLGSSGYNAGQDRTLDSRFGGASGNQIVTGNVQGFKYFRGRVGYTDPGAFRGNLSGQNLDNFIRDSAGTGDLYQGSGYGASAGAYYGDRYGAPKPAGFQQTSIGSGKLDAKDLPVRSGSDLRLGRVFNNPLIEPPRTGDLLLPGPVTNSTNNALITASPLYGVRQWDAGGNDPYFLSRQNNVPRTNQLDKAPADDASIRRMREELRGTIVTNGAVTFATPNVPGALPSNQLDAPAEGGSPDALTGVAVNDQFVSAPLDGAIGPDQTNRLVLVAPGLQSTQYAALESRFNQMKQSGPRTDAEAARDFQDQVRAKNAASGKAGTVKGTPGSTPNATPGGTPGVMPGANDLVNQARDNVAKIDSAVGPKPAPIQVKSLASGVRARGLAEVLGGAESLLKQGKFSAALDQYDVAEQVAPNNPLIRLGRSNAELGAGFYARAEQHLRQAFTQDTALLVGQYDLRAMLGEERVDYLVNDLKQIANAEANQVRPVFLLAYLSYNTGNERRAAAYLDLAEKRAGGKDPLLGLLRQYWSLPDDKSPDGSIDMNK